MLENLGRCGATGDHHLPLDVVDLLQKAPKLKGDFVCLLLLIVLKESVFTSSFFQDVDVLASSCGSFEARVQAYVDMLRPRFKTACIEASSSPVYHLEVVQMARQGTGRFCGSCRLMSVLGIVEKADRDGEADAKSLGAGVEAELVQLGNTSMYKLLEHDSGKLDEFVREIP